MANLITLKSYTEKAVSKISAKNDYYPVFFNIGGKLCIVIGGGTVAEQKVKILLKFNTRIRVISPVMTKNLSVLSQKGKIETISREYRDGDLDGAVLVFAATNKKETNEAIKKEALKGHIPVNVVDDPDLCDFIVPSIVKKESIVIAISTSGTLPLLSKILRKDIGNLVSQDYLTYAEKIGKFRRLLIESIHDKKRRKEILAEISKTGVEELAGMDTKAIKTKFLRNS
ncbi:MAG: bifunctional precorrin-2 dehydrogenase/sirohydrochlorin ferrochelatase [Proteobacteria bacterium]|nr:bifunctional precorrin-2 dehydrogenase/sirohydrochlorin ferrochelatase [Pseudomonadota bacterium]